MQKEFTEKEKASAADGSCPYCKECGDIVVRGSRYIKVEAEEGLVEEMECNECDKRWEVHYKLINVVPG